MVKLRSKKLFVFDIDSTIVDTNTAIADKINELCKPKKKLQLEDFKTYDLSETINTISCDLSVSTLFKKHGKDILTAAKTFTGAVEFVNSLFYLEKDVIFLTARTLDKKESTKSDLVKRGFHKDIPLFFSKEVEKEASEFNIDPKVHFIYTEYIDKEKYTWEDIIVFEDRAETLEEFHELCTTIKVEAEYNKHVFADRVITSYDTENLKLLENPNDLHFATALVKGYELITDKYSKAPYLEKLLKRELQVFATLFETTISSEWHTSEKYLNWFKARLTSLQQFNEEIYTRVNNLYTNNLTIVELGDIIEIDGIQQVLHYDLEKGQYFTEYHNNQELFTKDIKLVNIYKTK